MRSCALSVCGVLAVLLLAIVSAQPSTEGCVFGENECKCSRQASKGVCLRPDGGATESETKCTGSTCQESYKCDCLGKETCRRKACKQWKAVPQDLLVELNTHCNCEQKDSHCWYSEGPITQPEVTTTTAAPTTSSTTLPPPTTTAALPSTKTAPPTAAQTTTVKATTTTVRTTTTTIPPPPPSSSEFWPSFPSEFPF